LNLILLRISGWLVLAISIATAPVETQAQETLPLPRLSGPIVLDGRIDEPAWQELEPLEMTMFTPTFGGQMTEPTEAYVGYDDEYLYVAGRLYDSDPTGVRTNTLYRDQYSGDDVFAIVLDTYNDYESAVWFTTSPAGVRSDRSVSNDAEFQNGSAMNSDWNSYWDVATTETEEGWFAEFRIPFSSLGFQDVDGHVQMGMIVYRFIARKNERQLFPAIPPNWGMAFAKPSQSQRVTLEGVYARKPIYVTPYMLGGLDQTAELNGTGTAYQIENDRTVEAGVDVKYAVTNNLTLDATINTDFAQVEADSQQVNLTRFSLFFPEKRQFFQERSSLFDFNTGGPSRLFHSRRIGLDDDGGQVRILGGLRMVGRVGSVDVGLLNMQTAERGSLASENFGVARLRRQVFNPFSTVGAIVTTRANMDGDYSVGTGLDGIFRVTGDEYFTVKVASTFNPDTVGSPTYSLIDQTLFLGRWERRNQNGFSYSADYIRSGRNFAPRLGFALRSDFTQIQNAIQYQRFHTATSPFRSVSVRNESSVFVRNADRTVESASIAPTLQFEFKNGNELTLTQENNYESVRETFLLSDIAPVVPGEYWFHEGELRLMLARSGQVRGSGSVRAGTFYDGWRFRLSGGPVWSASKHLELGSSYTIDRIRFGGRGETLNSHLVSLRVQTALDIHLSATALLQYSNIADRMGVNARIRYHFREGSDLWIVYNDDLNTDRDVLSGPRLRLSQARTVMVKYTYTLGS